MAPSARQPAASGAATLLYVVVALTLASYYFGRDAWGGRGSGNRVMMTDVPDDAGELDDTAARLSRPTCPSAAPAGAAHAVLLEPWPLYFQRHPVVHPSAGAAAANGALRQRRPRLRTCVPSSGFDNDVVAHELSRHGAVDDCTFLSAFVSRSVAAYVRVRAQSIALAPHEKPRLLLVDVGAHVGACAIPAAAAGIPVVAVEANAATRALLADGVRASNVRVLSPPGSGSNDSEYSDDDGGDAFVSIHAHVPLARGEGFVLPAVAARSVASAPRIGGIIKVDVGDQTTDELRQAAQWLLNTTTVDIIGIDVEVTSASSLRSALSGFAELRSTVPRASQMLLSCFTERADSGPEGARAVRSPAVRGDWCRLPASEGAQGTNMADASADPFAARTSPDAAAAAAVTSVHLQWGLSV